MKKSTILKILILALALSLTAIQTDALDYPHNSVNNIGCDSCHYIYGTEPTLMLPWLVYGVDIDDTQYNSLCWSCHNNIIAPDMKTHSSLQIDNDYGNWTVECRVCHNPHYQKQFNTYGSETYLYSGISTGILTGQPSAGKSELTMTGAGWTINEYQGLVVIPNISQGSYGYRIESNTDSVLTIKGEVDLTKVTPGVDTFAIIYGKLINDTVVLDNITDPLTLKTGNRTVKFLHSTGTNSFADGDTTYDGICEVCHTETTHFRNDGTGPEQLHLNVGGAGGAYCIQCHPHTDGFAHGGGAGGGTGCVECHGHDAGTNFDPDMSVPYTPGTTASQGRGTYQSHSTHTETDIDDRRGPGIYCNTCHDINKFPFFKTGTDIDGDGNYNLAETDVCNTCHSTGGTYDGVNDPDLGAKYGNNGELKYNWRNRIYEQDGTLKAGNEKWCATCHDESPSLIQSVYAPNVIGDEDGAYTYGTGWGFYKTGHGLSSGDSYPASGGVTAGAGRTCLDCHDSTLSHIDGDARTFDDGEITTLDPSYYRLGYRLKQVGGLEPMLVPWPVNTVNSADNYRLCASCHTIAPAFTDVNDLTSTNLVTTGADGTKNRHAYHLTQNVSRYPADWSGADTDA